MLRIRTVKPELASHEELFELEQETGLPMRFAWVMLFCVCDREGRFAWRPRALKTYVLPYDEIDFSRVLDAWGTRGFIRKYRVADEWYGEIPTFTRHQSINHRESASDIPSIADADEVFQWVTDASGTREARVNHASATREARGPGGREGKGREGKTRESRIGEDELHENLPRQSWEEWLEFRRQKKHPMDATTLRKHLKLLAGFDSVTQTEIIDASIGSGWQGLFAPKGKPAAINNGKPPIPPFWLGPGETNYNPAHKAWVEKYG
jgi:hypothetical protein